MRQATLTTVSAKTNLSIMQRFCQLHPLPKTRGRPRLYPEALILTLALLQVRNNASWRQLRYACAQVFGSVKGAYGSYVGSRSLRGARSRVWGMWVLWNLVGLVQVGGAGVFVWVVAPMIFRKASRCLDKFVRLWYTW